MGRGKVELKRIEDKSSRQVSFSKRRNGLMKKACELSVLCDVDLALLVFSPRGRLYEFSSGESMTSILTRFQAYKNAEEAVHRTVHEKLAPGYTDVCTADELTEMVKWQLEPHNLEQLDVGGLDQLEQQFGTFLQQVKIRKSQLMTGVLKALQDKKKQLTKEKEFMIGEIMAARMKETNNDRGMAPPPQLPVVGLQFI